MADAALAQSFAEDRVLFNLRDISYDVVLIDWTLLDEDADVLLDEIFATHSDIRAIGLSVDAGQTKGDRVEAYLIKARTELPDLSRLVANVPPSTGHS